MQIIENELYFERLFRRRGVEWKNIQIQVFVSVMFVCRCRQHRAAGFEMQINCAN